MSEGLCIAERVQRKVGRARATLYTVIVGKGAVSPCDRPVSLLNEEPAGRSRGARQNEEHGVAFAINTGLRAANSSGTTLDFV